MNKEIYPGYLNHFSKRIVIVIIKKCYNISYSLQVFIKIFIDLYYPTEELDLRHSLS